MFDRRPRAALARILLTAFALSGASGWAAKSPRSGRPAKQPDEAPAETSQAPPPPSPQAQPSQPTPPPPPKRTTLHWPHGREWGDATLRALRSERTWIPA